MHLDRISVRPLRVPWAAPDLPHGVIEVNQKCNIRCFGCYKDKTSLTKTVAEVCDEIDLMVERRNLSTISFAGGEPLLHEDLEEMVAHAATRGLRPVVVTNGTRITPERLASLRKRGLAGVLIHIDRLQGKRPDTPVETSEAALNPLREQYIRQASEAGLEIGLALTLYQENLDELPDVIELGLRLPGVKYMLLTGYSQVANLDPREGETFLREEQTVTVADFFLLMQQSSCQAPTMYLPSSHRAEEVRWLFFLQAVSVGAGGELHAFPLDGRHRAALGKLMAMDRKRRGRYAFDEVPGALEVAAMVFLLAGSTLDPRHFLEALGFLLASLVRGNLKLFSSVFQGSPQLREDGEYEICCDCPDATVRHGQIVPVCLADILHPHPEEPAQA